MNDVVNKSQFAKLPFARKLSDEDKAVVSKLVKAQSNNVKGQGRNRAAEMPGMGVVSKVAMQTANNANDSRNLFQVLPDMELAKSILVSAILSPTDLTKRTLIYSLEDNQLDSNLSGPLLRLIKDRLEALIRINKQLPSMLEGALFGAGSYPILVLPPSTIDNVINTTQRPNMESLSGEVDKDGWYRPFGVLGYPDVNGRYTAAMEMFGLDTQKLGQSTLKENFTVSFERVGNEKAPLAKLKGKVFVTDNPDVLKNPQLIERIRKHRMSEIYGARFKRKGSSRTAGGSSGTISREEVSQEARGDKKVPTLGEVENMFYLNRQYTNTPMQTLYTAKQLGTENVGNPVVLYPPPEAVMPVHVPGNPRQHVGYFLILDAFGNPLSMSFKDDYYADIRSTIGGSGDMNSQLLGMVRRGQNSGSTAAFQDNEIAEMTAAYAKIVEDDLLNRLRSGAMTGDYQLSYTEEIMRLMFSRALKEKNTLMLFVPVELMTYIAFDYNEYGVGKSLLEDGKILGSIRAALLFAGTMAAIKNATGTQTVRITVPEEDDDAWGTVEFMLNEYIKINGGGMFPFGVTHPAEMITNLQNAGRNIVLEGNTAFPDAKFDVEDRAGTHRELNTDLDEMMRKRHIQMFGLTPEIMDASTGADFATTVVNQHLMLLKRVVQYQEDFCPFLTDFIRNYIVSSGTLMAELRQYVEENKTHLPKEYKNKIDDFLMDMLNVLVVNLPAPDIDRMDEQIGRFQKYTDAVTAALDAYFKEEMFDQTQAMELFESIPSAKAVLLGYFQRKWLRENNVLPELDIFNTVDEEESPVFDLMGENERHMDGILKSMEAYLEKSNRAARARRKRLAVEKAKMDAADAEGEGGDAGFSDPGYTGFDDGGDPAAGTNVTEVGGATDEAPAAGEEDLGLDLDTDEGPGDELPPDEDLDTPAT